MARSTSAPALGRRDLGIEPVGIRRPRPRHPRRASDSRGTSASLASALACSLGHNGGTGHRGRGRNVAQASDGCGATNDAACPAVDSGHINSKTTPAGYCCVATGLATSFRRSDAHVCFDFALRSGSRQRQGGTTARGHRRRRGSAGERFGQVRDPFLSPADGPPIRRSQKSHASDDLEIGSHDGPDQGRRAPSARRVPSSTQTWVAGVRGRRRSPDGRARLARPVRRSAENTRQWTR
jgi:hypothetical protein